MARSEHTATVSAPLRRDRLKVGLAFLVNGALWGSWIGRIPRIAGDLDLSERQVGQALLGLALATVVTLPLAGGLTTRVGARAVTAGGAVLGASGLALVALADDVGSLVGLLCVLSAGGTSMDVAMNGQGVALESRYGRPIVVGLHGLWSVGALLGTAVAGLTVWADVPTARHLGVAAVVVAVAGVVASRTSDAAEVDRDGPRRVFALPRGRLWLLGGIAFAAALSEGAVADWGGLYLERVLGTGAGVAASAYVVFSATMAVVRLLGDRVTARFGRRSVVRAGGAVAAGGMVLALAVDAPVGALVGFAVAGVGIAAIMPIAFSSAGDVPGSSQGAAVAAVASVGYAGFLVGPPLIGYLADLVGLRLALGAVVVTAASLALSARALPRATSGGTGGD